MKQLITTLMACIVILCSVLCVLSMVPFALAVLFINSLHQGTTND